MQRVPASRASKRRLGTARLLCIYGFAQKRMQAPACAKELPIKGEEVAPMLEPTEGEVRKQRHSDASFLRVLLMACLLACLVVVPPLMVLDVVMLVMREANLETSAALLAKILLLVVVSCAACRMRPAWCTNRGVGLACVVSLLFGLAVFVSCVKIFLIDEFDDSGAPLPIIEGNSSASPRVAIIGAGPSGMGALWALRLHAPTRDVTIFEMADSVGGHGTTVHDQGKPIDIGFIFSTPYPPAALTLP